jgi:hypothetical protein
MGLAELTIPELRAIELAILNNLWSWPAVTGAGLPHVSEAQPEIRPRPRAAGTGDPAHERTMSFHTGKSRWLTRQRSVIMKQVVALANYGLASDQ